LTDKQKGRKDIEEIYGSEYKERELREKDPVFINFKYKPQEKSRRDRDTQIIRQYR
jgi:hypothetical protein